MIERARTALGELAHVRGVRAAVLASESDGMAAASVASVGVAEDALAAFAMALFRRARMANAAAGYGATRFLALDAAHGRLYVAACGDLGSIEREEACGASRGRVRHPRAAERTPWQMPPAHPRRRRPRRSQPPYRRFRTRHGRAHAADVRQLA